MPIQSPQSVSVTQLNLLSALQATGITQTSPGGKARAFSDAVGNEIGGLESRSFAALGQTLLPYATGDNLDFIGEMFGVPRIQAQTGSSPVSDNNFVFYVQSGNFGNINSGNSITVPAGTLLSTASAYGPTYTTNNPILLPSSSNSVPFSATSTTDGSFGNVLPNAITNHNFQGYTNFRYGSLLVTNNYGVVTGVDEEDDTDYRYRINLKISSKNGAAESDLRLAILLVPGIQNVVFVRQAGTYLCYVYATSPTVPTSVMQLVQAQMNTVTAWPLVGTAVQPDLVGISLSTTVTFVSGATESQQSAAIANAQTAAANYINNLDSADGQTFVINQLAAQIEDADPNILDIGNPDQPINNIYIWRSREDGTRYSRNLINNYEPQQGERLCTEFSISVPINLSPVA
jgi:hypothetical protein